MGNGASRLQLLCSLPALVGRIPSPGSPVYAPVSRVLDGGGGWWGRLPPRQPHTARQPATVSSSSRLAGACHSPDSAACIPALAQIALAAAIAGVVAVKLVDVDVDVDVGNLTINEQYTCLLGQDVGSSSLCT